MHSSALISSGFDITTLKIKEAAREREYFIHL
jgi:hypothetical protein